MSNQISFTYTFHAPRELVFKAFTEADHLKNWWGPKGWKFEVLQSDFRPGGVFLYSQKPDDGDAMWVKFVYSEIVTPEKIVYSSFFSDREGNTIRAPFNENWPLETLTSMSFMEDGGKTTVTVTLAPVSAAEDEINTFIESKEMTQEGFIGTFKQLEDYLLNTSK
ncbi:SRPBCC family protein [Gracilibacillus dipsosauri]|uniref:Polyketide cyclase n=1 Tax=Gracilibacillus dipsosauri TaxID=178340 RepID=A0A317L335_9BACI|nr:SRPBCC domain-containing protein [Gracilibacillus dipsosauri]PWU70291.1 polyketide cyclase [Gracilibacillus dipsosauri]